MTTEYPNGEAPTVAPVDQPTFDPESDKWVNYWDANPIEHGGTFIRWDGSMWKVVEVHPPSVWPEPDHIVDVYWFDPADVWVDPDDPLTDFTEQMKRIIESLGESHYPNGEGNPFLDRVAYYVADLARYTGSQGRSETFEIEEGDVEAYWEKLESYGVDPADVEGVSGRDLPG